jgi:hypothetical protein
MRKTFFIALFSFLCCGLAEAQYACYDFSFNVTDSTGKTIKVTAELTRIVQHRNNKNDTLKNSPMKYAELTCGGGPYQECLSAHWGCEGDKLKYMKISIHYSDQTMTLLFEGNLAAFLVDCEMNALCIANIVFKPSTTLYWNRFDKDHKVSFRTVQGLKN